MYRSGSTKGHQGCGFQPLSSTEADVPGTGRTVPWKRNPAEPNQNAPQH
jgi:hypothetical protein